MKRCISKSYCLDIIKLAKEQLRREEMRFKRKQKRKEAIARAFGDFSADCKACHLESFIAENAEPQRRREIMIVGYSVQHGESKRPVPLESE